MSIVGCYLKVGCIVGLIVLMYNGVEVEFKFVVFDSISCIDVLGRKL